MKFNEYYYLKEADSDRLKDQTFTTSIKGFGDLSGSVPKLIKVTEQYPIQKIPNKLFNKFKPLVTDFGSGDIEVKYKGQWTKYNDLPDEEKRKIDQEEKQDIESTKLQYPIIVAGDINNPKAIIDGNHRFQKAINHNVKYIPAKFISLQNLNQIKDQI